MSTPAPIIIVASYSLPERRPATRFYFQILTAPAPTPSSQRYSQLWPAERLICTDSVILDKLDYLPFRRVRRPNLYFASL